MTPPKQKAFLAAFSVLGNITEAARVAKVNRNTHYEWMKDVDYAAAFEAAREVAADHLEAEARRRAVDGWEEPVIYQGELQFKRDRRGRKTDKPLTVLKKSDTMLIFLLKGARPDKYAKFSGEVTHKTVPTSRMDLSKLSDDELTYLRDLAARLSQPEADRGGAGAAEPEQDPEILPGDGSAAA